MNHLALKGEMSNKYKMLTNKYHEKFRSYELEITKIKFSGEQLSNLKASNSERNKCEKKLILKNCV